MSQEQPQGELSEAELRTVTGGGCGHFRLCSRDGESLCWPDRHQDE